MPIDFVADEEKIDFQPEEPEFQGGLVSPKERRFSMYDVPALVDKLSESPLPTYGMDVPTESVPVALAKTVAGLGKGVVSPLGAAATAAAPIEAAAPALRAGFGALGTKGVYDIALEQITRPEARPKTIPEAVELAGKVVPQLAMAAAPFIPEVTAAAYKNPKTGEVTAGSFHKEAAAEQGVKAPEAKEARETPDYGFIVEDPKTGVTEFKTRPETEPIAQASGQLVQEPERPGQPHSDDIAAPGTDTPIAETKVPEKVRQEPLSPEAQAEEQARLAAELGEEEVAPEPTKALKALREEGVTEQNAKAILSGTKTPDQVVNEQLGVKVKYGSPDSPHLIIDENPDGSRTATVTPDAGPAQMTPKNIGQNPHDVALRMAIDQGVERINAVLEEHGLIPKRPSAEQEFTRIQQQQEELEAKRLGVPVVRGEPKPTTLTDEQLWQKAQRKEKLTPEEQSRLDEIEARGEDMGEAETTALQAEADALKQVPPAVSPGDAREPWQMTKAEVVDRVRRQLKASGAVDVNATYLAGENHREIVREAVEKGLPVPPEVLADYPSLAKSPPAVLEQEAQPTVPAAGKAEGGVSAPPAPAIPEGGISPAKVQVGESIDSRDIKEGETIRWEPNENERRYQSPVEGIVQDVIHNTEGEIGFHIFSPKEGDPSNVVRVWANRGKVVSRKPSTVEKEPVSRERPEVFRESGTVPRPKTVTEIADEIAARGIDPQASYGQFVKARDLKPEISAKEWLPIYRQSLKLAKLNKAIEVTKKSAPPTTPPSTGEGMAGPATTELYAGVPVGLDKFIESDLKPLLKKGVDATKALSDVVVNWFSPASHTKGRDVDVLFESKGYAEQFKTKAAAAVEQANKMVGSLPEKEQIDFIDRVKRGEKQATPELQTVADLLRKWDDRLYQEAKVYKPSLNYLDNHLRVLWKVIPGSPEAIGLSKTSIGSKRPWRGSQGFTRRHVLEDMSEGLDLGGVPVTYNPVEMFLLHAQDVMKFVSANRAWEALKKTGSVEFVREGKKPPEGFRRFDDPIAKPYFRTEEGLKAKPGEWWVDEGTARMLHNYLSRDYIRTGKFGPVGRGLLALKNATTAIELGLSPFHAVFESNETMASSLGLGIAKMASGKAREGIKDIVSAGASPVTTAKLGGAAIRFAKDESTFAQNYPDAYKWFTQRYPEARQMIKDLFSGGGQVSMHEDYRIRESRIFSYSIGMVAPRHVTEPF